MNHNGSGIVNDIVSVNVKRRMNTNMIEIKDIKKGYKNLEVLKGVNLSIEKGEIFALLGSNGAGKTTLIRMMATLHKADAGSISIGGYDVFSKPNEVRKIIS